MIQPCPHTKNPKDWFRVLGIKDFGKYGIEARRCTKCGMLQTRKIFMNQPRSTVWIVVDKLP